MALAETIPERVRSYRPILESIIFGLALLGILDVVHLYMQHNRGFEQGCFGFSTLESGGSVFDCAAVTGGPSSQLFGVSNITWGFAFYLSVAALTAILFWSRPALRGWIHSARAGLLTGGFLYSGYLVYLQVGPIGALCALCLVSATIATLLFGVQSAALATSSSPTESSMSSHRSKRQATVFAYLVVATAVLIGADVTYFSETSTPNPRGSAPSATPASAQCELDTAKDPLPKNGSSLVGFQDITKGNSDASVTVVEYFDPNCPHCKDFHEVMKKLVKTHQDEVQFVYKPFPLRASSLPEIQALYIANRSGKFSEMLDAQYARQKRGGINKSDLRAIASDIGMDPDVLLNRIEKNAHRQQIVRMRKRAINIGVESTPTVLVNGHFVRSRSLECMKTFISQAQAGTLASSASK
ncbi:MAG: thioredoxin domain-containing protein [Salinibacter sp.]|uniref:thioredoxin domain-containing protein n=1 Tax=Salinibacter sp. TaxID=2065818 RepID=UPI0035D4D332